MNAGTLWKLLENCWLLQPWKSTSLVDKISNFLGCRYLRSHLITRPLRVSVVTLCPHFGISMVDACLNKVVDSNLKVIGVDSLRVVDASTFFNSPGTNPQATTMMLGRYIGIKMLEERAASQGHPFLEYI
ncbi:putative (R)-mandelonitrile lyase [Helianthus annuus]|nr:putative (R)-mandelonitrile lyase [Helianthus annuus]